jgi:plastocyanin
VVGATNIVVMRVLVGSLVLAVSATCVGACGASPTNSADNSPPGAPAAATVEVKGFAFQPPVVSVPSGSTVEWRFNDGFNPHNVVGGGGLRSGDHTKGTYRHTFSTAGTFAYDCDIHPWMRGTVIVA